ncbi:MAG: hypothetical protein LBI60_01015 [Bacteroidales bacterium]|nr:hypothetical protein [Bacteroidales bacterium]
MKTFFFLVLSVFILISCSKTVNNGESAYSIKLPGSWKKIDNQAVLSGIGFDMLQNEWQTSLVAYFDIKKNFGIAITEQPVSQDITDIKKSLMENTSEFQDEFGASQTPFEWARMSKITVGKDDFYVSSEDTFLNTITSAAVLHDHILYSFLIIGSSAAANTTIIKTIRFNPNGFLTGVYDGIIFPVSFIKNLLMDDIRIFAKSNNGASYIAGFILGVLILFALPGKLQEEIKNVRQK